MAGTERPPSPPPLFGAAEDLAARAGGDFDEFGRLLNQVGYVVLDYETTGLDAGNEPVQVAAVRFQDGLELDFLNLYMNPGEPLGEWSRANLRNRSGRPLTDEWLAEQMPAAEAHRRLVDFIGDQIVVAQYLPFDAEVLERTCWRHEIPWEMAGGLDTKGFFAAALPPGPAAPPGYRLAQLTEFFGVDLGDDHHDAIHDVLATNEVLRLGLAYCAWHGDAAALDGRLARRRFVASLRTWLWRRRVPVA